MVQPTEDSNPFTPPQAQLETPSKAKRRRKLMPHEKAGRVIRLMALLGVVAVAGIGAAVLLPEVSGNQTLQTTISLIPLAFALAILVGLFFVGSAVMRHESWARVIGIIYGLVALIGFPIGTLIGVYVLWQLVFKWGEVEPAVS